LIAGSLGALADLSSLLTLDKSYVLIDMPIFGMLATCLLIWQVSQESPPVWGIITLPLMTSMTPIGVLALPHSVSISFELKSNINH
jgi:hypothetical protein